jgi:methylenetetrahydrofolate reductase (NADPH)
VKLLKDIYKRNCSALSFEVFPPKKEYEIETLYETIKDLKELNPDFISVTYGSGGGTKDKTVEICSKIKNEYNIETMAHLTCVNSSKSFVISVLEELKKNNIKNILALRGDPPKDSNPGDNIYGDFKYASDLVRFIKTHGDWSIAVAGYPEGHQAAKSIEEDVDYLKLKVDCGADVIITQLFFDNNDFYRFRDLAVKKGIDKPIIPGIFPIFNFNTIKKITSLSNAKIPQDLFEKISMVQDSIEEVEKIGIEHAVSQADDLLKNGVPGLHFYSMNKSAQIKKIVRSINFCVNVIK